MSNQSGKWDLNETIDSEYDFDTHSLIFQMNLFHQIVSSRLESMIVYFTPPQSHNEIKLRLLLDTGSTHSFIKISNLEKYNLPIFEKFRIALQPFGCPVDIQDRAITSIKLKIRSPKSGLCKNIEIKVIAVPKICDQINSYALTPFQNDELKNRGLVLNDQEANRDGLLAIDMLVGQDYYYQFVEGPNFYFTGGLVLISTFGGYIMGGSVNHNYLSDTSCQPVSLCATNEISSFAQMSLEEEQQTLDQFISLENIGVHQNETSPVLQFFNKTIKHTGTRYSVELPKKDAQIEKLMTNFPQVFHRLESGFAKLNKPSKKHLKEKYINIMEEQINSGIIEEVEKLGTSLEIQNSLDKNPRAFDDLAAPKNVPVHYLPHFPVQKASDGSLRLVYDAKARPFKGHLCLNDCLERGPKLINSLVGILIKFRLKRYVCKGDIAKAFLQIEIEPNDRDLLRLLWKRDEIISIYRFARLPFGLTSSPFILAATLKYHLEKTNLSPEVQKIILDSFYVDDLVYSMDSIQELIDRRLLIMRLFSEAGMPLRKWNTNHVELRQSFLAIEENRPEIEPVLGLIWNVIADTVNINGDRIASKAHPATTKRGLYSSMAQVFDPLGLLSPYVFLCKLLVRDVWERNLTWDDPLPEDLMIRWGAWKSELSLLNTITLPRHIGIQGAEKQRLHGFCDASFAGFGAAIYLVTFKDNAVVSHLITSKTRIAPKKITSVPRLELCSALLLSNLMATVMEMIPEVCNQNVHYHSDSANVIYWLRSGNLSQTKDRTNFVSNRICKILELSHSDQWHHVGTKDNPADMASRGILLSKLEHNSFWLNGPQFIKSPELQSQTHIDFKKMPEGVQNENKLVRTLLANVKSTATGLTSLISLEYTNDYCKLIRLTNIVIKTAYIWLEKTRKRVSSHESSSQSQNSSVKKKTNRHPPNWRHMDLKAIALMPQLGIPDNNEAELRWIREVQHQHFSDVLHMCQGCEVLVTPKTKSLVKNLKVFYDPKLKLLKLKTRLPHSELDGATVNPILLPRESKLTSMIITSVHQRLLHAGVRQTLTAIRGEFWFTAGRQKVTSVINGCVTCKKAVGKTYALPPHPDLPDFRVLKSEPFRHVGIDFAGPYLVTEGDREIKAYVLVITCTSTRAVWFEHTQGLSAYQFLLALKRFVGRRGAPATIVSDNAKAFACCHRKLVAIYKNKEVQQYLIERRISWNIDWHFYCERAPWQGGFIETVVKLFKAVSKRVIGSAKMSYLEFATVVVEAEGIVNSRPITFDYSTSDEEGPLSPSKIIYGYNLTEIPPMRSSQRDTIPEVTGTSTLQRYWFLESVKSSMWNRWSKEYLTALAERHFNNAKSKGVQAVPTVGEVVLLRNENAPRRKWHLARVLEVKVSPRDGKVRTCVIKTHNDEGKVSILKRSPNFLVPLEVRMSDEERENLQNGNISKPSSDV